MYVLKIIFTHVLAISVVVTCGGEVYLDTLRTQHRGLSLLQVLKESFKLYRAINDGIINLVDKVSMVPVYFFDLIVSDTFEGSYVLGFVCAVL